MKIDEESARMKELRITWRVVKDSKIALVSIGIVASFFIISLLAPWLSPHDPTQMYPAVILKPPSREFPLGTDQLGRDFFARILYGARISMLASIVIVTITLIIGMPVGAISGYVGGKGDEALMRFTDIIMSFPYLMLPLLLAYILGRGIFSAALALSLTGWTSMARIVRSVVLAEKEKDYVVAARVLGKSHPTILFGEILPNCLFPVIVDVVMRMGTTIIALAGLSFIGVGVQPPQPDWGIIVSEGRIYLMEYPMLSLLPGILIIIVVLAYNMIGDRLRDALDPQLRRELAGLAEA